MFRIVLVSSLMLLMSFFRSETALAAPPPAEYFGMLPAIYDASISPDSTELAVISIIDDRYGVRVFDLTGKNKAQRAILFDEGVKPAWIKWANNDRILVSLWRSSQYQNTPISSGLIYTIEANTMAGEVLVEPPRGMFRQFNNRVIDFLEDDPNHILMTYSDTEVSQPDVMKVNVANGKAEKLESGRSYVQSWVTDLRGQPRVRSGLSERSTSEPIYEMQIRDAEGDSWRDVKEFPGIDAEVDIFGFTGNPNEMIIGQYNGRDTLGLYIYDLSRKKVSRELFHDDKYDVSGLVIDKEGGEVIGAKFTSDTDETKLFGSADTTMEAMRRRFPGKNVDFVDQSDAKNVLVFKVSGGNDPGRMMLYTGGGAQPQLISALYKQLPSPYLGKVVSASYKARDGLDIPAYITLPPGMSSTAELKGVPFIVLPHGGPYARESNRFDYFAQFFASRGYGVLQMNFRGSAGYGKEFQDAGRKKWTSMQDDVEDGTNWLASQGYSDPERVCIAGWSYGGYAALMGGIRNPELYDCIISIAGVTDLKGLVAKGNRYRFGSIRMKYSITDGFDNGDEMNMNSPVERADDIQDPVFLAHGTYDEAVDFDQYSSMVKALKKARVKTTKLAFKEEDHYMSLSKNRIAMFRELDNFLKSTIGPSEYAK